MSKQTKKLTLAKETVTHLGEGELDDVAAGIPLAVNTSGGATCSNCSSGPRPPAPLSPDL